ncbi:MAG: XdhC family protein [Actinomycetota bacterium]|nr:XdhC family protein [Actinomycetota bacterium]
MSDFRSLLETIEDWVDRGEQVALATVVATKKSAPQPAGTKMAVNEIGQVSGAVSGGCVEGAVVEVAETVIGGAPPRLLHYGIADDDAWDVGLPCGGEISVWVEAYGGLQARFHALARSGARAALVTVLQGGPLPGAKLLVGADGAASGSLGSAGLDAAALELAGAALWSERSEQQEVAGATLFVDVVAPPPRLIVFGAVDFAAQLAEVAVLAGWRAFVIDPRARFATPERFPAAERVIAAWPQEALAQLDPIDRATAVAVLTHDPKLDDAALSAVLASEAGYIGAMGSRRAQEHRRERLLAAGMTEDQLQRISAPIGLDLGALTAAETALSIMSEIVAVRRGRTGGRLIDSRGRIHDAVSA